MTKPHVSLRAAIRARLITIKWTTNQLALAVKGRVPRSVVYAFLVGTRDTCSQNVDAMMEAVGLIVKPLPSAGRTSAASE